MRENEKINIENIGFDLKDELYWKNYPNCPIDNHPIKLVKGKNGESYVPGEPTQYYYEILYQCLHCFHQEWERDST